MNVTTNETTETKPLWPDPLEIIGLTGHYESGKTLFAVTICPGPATKVYDFEKSAGTHQRVIGYERIDVPSVMLKSHANGYKAIDVFQWWLADIRATPPGKYRVIVADPVTDLEAGLVDWVNQNPGFFGHTHNQYAKMSGLMWGDVKAYWKIILTDVAARCETFAFVAHLGREFVKNEATGKEKPKGKETLTELSSLYLWMERKKNEKGERPAKPSARVLKTRLSSARIDPTSGDVEVVPTLPPRIPVATPAAIRQYMLTPPDYAKLTEDERSPDPVFSEEEKLRLELAKAEAERDAEVARLERSGIVRRSEAAPTKATSFLDRIAAAASVSELEAVGAEIAAADGRGEIDTKTKTAHREAYKTRKATLASATTSNGQPTSAVS